MTLNDGFSVVAATRIDQPVLDAGQQGVLLGLGEPVDLVEEQHGLPVVEVALACRRGPCTARTSLTPAVTAESSTNRRPAAVATRWARVVLPVPGGPQMIADSGPAAAAGAVDQPAQRAARAQHVSLAADLLQ